MNNKVVVDIDGVLANFETAFCKKFGYDKRYLVSLEKRYPKKEAEIKRFVFSSYIYAKLKLLDIGWDIINFFDRNAFEIHIVSSRPIKTYIETQRWLKNKAIPYKHLYLHKNRNKIPIIKEINPYCIVDDLLSIVEPVSLISETHSFLIDYPWNQKDSLTKNIHRIKDFYGFLHVFKDINGN